MSQKLPSAPPVGDRPEASPLPTMGRSVAELLVGQTILITVDNWFIAPDGAYYRTIFGTLRAVHTAEATLGVRPNGKSTNWYLEIGNMIIAGCQIHYAVRCVSFNPEAVEDETVSPEHGLKKYTRRTCIYNADAETL